MRFGLLITVTIGAISIASAAFPQAAPSPKTTPPVASAHGTDEIVKKIEQERRRFEQQQKETEDLFDKTIEIFRDQHKEIQLAEKGVDDLIARLESTINKAGDKGELMDLIDLMIRDAGDGKSRAESLSNAELGKIFSELESKYRNARQELIDTRIDALSTLRQLKAQKEIISLARRAFNLQQAYTALNEAIEKFKGMVEAGKKLLESLPKPPGS